MTKRRFFFSLVLVFPLNKKSHLTFGSPLKFFPQSWESIFTMKSAQSPMPEGMHLQKNIESFFCPSKKTSMSYSSNQATLTSQIILGHFLLCSILNLFNCPHYVGLVLQRGGPPHSLLLLLGLWPVRHSHLIQIYQRQHEKLIRRLRHEEKKGANKLRVLHLLSARVFFFHISTHFA